MLIVWIFVIAEHPEQVYAEKVAQQAMRLQKADQAFELKRTSVSAHNARREQLQLELAEARANREALRNKQVPNFFSFPLGKELILARAPNMEKLAHDLGVFSRRGTGHPGDDQRSTSSRSSISEKKSPVDVATHAEQPAGESQSKPAETQADSGN